MIKLENKNLNFKICTNRSRLKLKTVIFKECWSKSSENKTCIKINPINFQISKA